MHEPPQKKNSSWTPTPVQKKGKSPSKLGHFSIQPKPNPSSAPPQEIGEYSRASADRLAANVMRGLQAKEQEQAETSTVQPRFESPWAPTFEPPPPLPQSPASQLKGAFAPVSENPIQRQCAECAKEEEEQKGEERKDVEEIGIQTKLTIGAPGDTYEQEADRVETRHGASLQVMSMSAPPDSSASVQRQLETNNPKQIWQRAQSIKPVVQRRSCPRVQMRQMIQRAHQIDGNQASGDLESRLNASKGGGSPLSENVRGFMEPRFGADFSGVRVHTGGEAVQMNQELGAQAFTHGSDVYFGEGKEPGNNELTAHELTHVVQQNGNIQRKKLKSEDKNKKTHYQRNQVLIQRTPVSRSITPLLSYSATDWAVTTDEEIDILRHLRGDSDLSTTIRDLDSASMLEALIRRVDETANRRELIQLLGSRLNSSARALVEPHIRAIGQEWELQFNLGRLGVTSAAPTFAPSPLESALVSSDPRDPFTGSGATGVSPTSLSIGWRDQALLAARDSATVAEYSNPIPGSLPAYLATLSPTQRTQQAELLLRRQISSIMAQSYAGNIPSRAQVIRGAAREHNLHPQLVAAFLLAEQRDQSRNEDAKDYLGATSRIFQGNTSIGLGQVVVSTARRGDLFADLLSSSTRSGLSHDDIAERLASDEFNIFAVASYIRQVADDGATINIATLPNTQARFPRINLAAYANNSSTWPDDNIRVLGMYYTSRAWTDDLRSAAWGDFVFEAYQDVIASGVL